LLDLNSSSTSDEGGREDNSDSRKRVDKKISQHHEESSTREISLDRLRPPEGDHDIYTPQHSYFTNFQDAINWARKSPRRVITRDLGENGFIGKTTYLLKESVILEITESELNEFFSTDVDEAGVRQ